LSYSFNYVQQLYILLNHQPNLMELRKFRFFVGSVPAQTSSSELLMALREQAGGDIRIEGENVPPKIKSGFCFISCSCEMTNSILKQSKVKFEDRILDIKKFREGEELQKYKLHTYGKRIHIKNLDRVITAADLEMYFGQFGSLNKVFLTNVQQRNRYPMVSGHVIYQHAKAAKAALQYTHTYIRGKKVLYESYLDKRTKQKKKKKRRQGDTFQNSRIEQAETTQLQQSLRQQVDPADLHFQQQQQQQDIRWWVNQHCSYGTLKLIYLISLELDFTHSPINIQERREPNEKFRSRKQKETELHSNGNM